MAIERPHRGDGEPVLTVQGMRKQFKGLTALDGVDLEVREGEIAGLVGPNGAGKSTLFNCVMGVFPPTSGTVYLYDREITGRRTSALVQRGLARTFQIPRVFPDLTVRENVYVNQNHHGEGLLATAFTRVDEAVVERTDELIAFVGMDHLADEAAQNLSTGQKKLLGIVSSIVGEPAVVMLDEPTAGVNPGLVDEILDSLLALNEAGTTFLIIEHDMDVIKRLSDHLYVLAGGKNLVEGEPEHTLDDPRVLEAYFGL